MAVKQPLGCMGMGLLWGICGLVLQSHLPAPALPYSRAGPFCISRCGASVPIPVPTQVQNYQRIEQNLQSPPHYQAPR